MKKRTGSLFAAFLALVLMSCTAPTTTGSEEVLELPSSYEETFDERWRLIFFREINQRAQDARLENLQGKSGSNVKEIRLWVGFDQNALRGIILEEDQGAWKAKYVAPLDSPSAPTLPVALPEPKSGWKAFWQEMERLQVFSLPGVRTQDELNPYPDATGMVIEIRMLDRPYRNYLYGGIESKTTNSKEARKICQKLETEFGIELLPN